jgi:hypothetical protein
MATASEQQVVVEDGRMGWFDTALAVTSTIGKIAGALSGESAGVADIGPRGDGPHPKLGQLVFLDTGPETYVWNQSSDADAGLFFPGDPNFNVGAQQIYLPAASKKYPISSMFQTYAEADVDQFTMQNLPSISGAGIANGGPDINIGAQSNQLVPPGVAVDIKPNFSFKLNASDRTLLVGVVGTLTLAAITLLNVRGAGNTAVRLINAFRKPRGADVDDPQHITVDIPTGIDINDGLTWIDICAAVGNLQPSIDAFMEENGDRFVPLTDEDRAKIAAAESNR